MLAVTHLHVLWLDTKWAAVGDKIGGFKMFEKLRHTGVFLATEVSEHYVRAIIL